MVLWIRADASPDVGLGHVMRCLAIAERAEDIGLASRFVVGGGPVGIDVLRRRGWTAIAAPARESEWLREVRPTDLVVFDGYGFGPQLMEHARDRGCRVGAIDDRGAGRFPVDVVLNQNPVEETRYQVLEGTAILLGPTYALVRKEFVLHRRERGTAAPETLLVTLGGSDAAGLTDRIVEALAGAGVFRRLLVVLGPAAPPPGEALRGGTVTVVRAPANVASTFDAADAAISAAGTTTWELLCMGIPVALVQVADNQAGIGEAVAREGAGYFLRGPQGLAERLGPAVRALADPGERRAWCANALRLVDGGGARRFLDAMTR